MKSLLFKIVDLLEKPLIRRFAGGSELAFIPIAFLIFGFFFSLVIIVLLWPFAFALLWSRFHRIQEHWWVRVIAVVCLAGIAYLFYTIKRDYRAPYGLAEIVMGIVACWVVLRNVQADRMTITIGLAASVYFIVRGIDNYFAGVAPPKPKSLPVRRS